MAKISRVGYGHTSVVPQVEFFFDHGEDEFQPVVLAGLLVKEALTAEEVLAGAQCFAIQFFEETAADLGDSGRTLSTLPKLASVGVWVLSALAED